MQKNVRSLAACAAITMLLTGCAGSHTHQTSGTWEADLKEHWQSCSDCGKKLDKGAHTLDEFERCAICGAEVVDWGDSQSLYQYTERGELLRISDYDASGKTVTETVFTYEYDTDGNLLHSSTLVDGVLVDAYTYTVVNGESIVSEYIDYLEDGSRSVNDYDENGNGVRSVFYNSEGEVDLRTESEYALSSNGEWYEAVCTTTEADGSSFVMEFSEHGDQTGSTRYDAEGNLVYREAWAYTYDEDGNWQTMRSYYNDLLVSETIFATVIAEDSSMTYPETVTEYEEGGAKTVTVYDENGETVRQTRYDASGKAVS